MVRARSVAAGLEAGDDDSRPGSAGGSGSKKSAQMGPARGYGGRDRMEAWYR